eukprot:4031591-Amphidinium_carterae.1
MLCNSSTCSLRPLVFAFNSPELSPLLASLMMTSTPSRVSSSKISNLSLQCKYGVFTIAT